MRRAERGQAAILAVVGLLALSIGMYTTYNLGRAVYEKIQLQNAADAQAYSLATLEARTFNFIAFSNRAQVANYVQMMEAQAYLSNLMYLEALTGNTGDKLQAAGEVLSYIPYLQSVAESVRVTGVGFEQTSAGFGSIVDMLDDDWYRRLVELQTTRNYALFVVSAALVSSTLLQVQDGGKQLLEINDPDAEMGSVSEALNVVNTASFMAAFDWVALRPGDDGERADRLMTELVNASRYGTGAKDFVVARSRLAALEDVLVSLASLQGELEGESLPGRVQSVLDDLFSIGFEGTTKLLRDEGEFDELLEETAMSEADRSALAVGAALVSKDHGALLGPDRMASVISTPERSRVCRYHKPENYGRAIRLLLPMPDPDCTEDQHKWRGMLGLPGGITPYFKFASRDSGVSAERQSFNQPDVWILLSKTPDDMAHANELRFRMEHGGETAAFDGRIGEAGMLGAGFAEGVHAMARAQVYYHRPGAWQEPPNFFNPFWASRLAPKNAAIKRLLEVPGIGGVVGQMVADNVWMF